MKHRHELAYWNNRHVAEGRLRNDHFRAIFLAMAEKIDASFLHDQVVADFGCGPRGSLTWARDEARLLIGLDVLAGVYWDRFPEVKEQGMVYVTTTEHSVPLSDGLLDTCFSLNALDHVDNFECMIMEINRVLKSDGHLYASFNINGRATSCEPQSLTEDKVKTALITAGFHITSCRITDREDHIGDFYQSLIHNKPHYTPGREAFMWVVARNNG